jgi:hypothetical protein
VRALKTVMFYHKDTGMFAANQLLVSDERMVALNTPKDHVAIDGHHFDHLSQRVDVTSGEIVDYQPPQPSVEHEWSGTARRWQLNGASQAKRQASSEALARISQLEAQQPRALRETALGLAGGRERLLAIETEIQALRANL